MSNYLNTITGTIDFGPFSEETSVYLAVSKDDLQWIEDIEFILYGQPSPSNGISVDDLYIYLNGFDIHQQVLSGLRKLLDGSDQAEIKKSYQSAVEERIELDRERINRFKNIIFFGGLSRDLKKEEQLSEEISSRPKLSEALTKLGDRTLGHHGSVDVFNYLYRRIEIPPLSLRELIQSLPGAPKQWQDDWKNALPAILTFSFGPSAQFEPHEHSDHKVAAGSVTYDLMFKYQYSEEFSSLADQLSTKGDIQKTIHAIFDIVKKMSEDLDRSNSQITNVIRGVQESHKEL